MIIRLIGLLALGTLTIACSEKVPAGAEVSVVSSAGPSGAAADSTTEEASRASFRDLSLPPSTLGGSWQMLPGVVIEDWVTIVPKSGLQTGDVIRKNWEPKGVVSMADLSLVRLTAPLDTVTVRAYEFRDAAACTAWVDEKYQQEGWEDLYSLVSESPVRVFDSKEIPKRIAHWGRYWITAHHIAEGDEHLKALAAVTEQLGFPE